MSAMAPMSSPASFSLLFSWLLMIILLIFSSGSHTIISIHSFTFTEATVKDIQLAFNHNQLTSRQLVEFYLGEIHRLNPELRAVIEVNPDALYEADRADCERKAKSVSGLHGIPVLLKDNIGTKNKLNTTAGSFALVDSMVPRDAGVVKRLKKAGAIILGKTSLSEWAAFRSTMAPNGWCGRSGQGRVICFVIL